MMDIEELFELLTKEQKREITQLIFDKIKKGIDNIDEKALGEAYTQCLTDCEFIYDVDFGELQEFLAKKMLDIVKNSLKGK